MNKIQSIRYGRRKIKLKFENLKGLDGYFQTEKNLLNFQT